MARAPLVWSCPLETQSVVSTIAPLLYGSQEGWRALETLFASEGALGDPIGGAFCSYPATSALQARLARSLCGADAATRASLLGEINGWFGIDAELLPPPAGEGDWTVNEAIFTPIDRLRGSTDLDPAQALRLRCLRKVLNSEIDVVLEGSRAILFIEAKLTSPLEMDQELEIGQLLRQGLVAALVQRIVDKPVLMATLGVSERDARKHKERVSKTGLRPDPSALWRDADSIADAVKVVPWSQVHAKREMLSNPLSVGWFEAMTDQARVWDKRTRSYVPIIGA